MEWIRDNSLKMAIAICLVVWEVAIISYLVTAPGLSVLTYGLFAALLLIPPLLWLGRLGRGEK